MPAGESLRRSTCWAGSGGETEPLGREGEQRPSGGEEAGKGAGGICTGKEEEGKRMRFLLTELIRSI